VPFALFPTPFPRSQFIKAQNVQLYFNTLMHRVRNDTEFLLTNLAEAAEVDDFTAKLVRILKTVSAEGLSQTISLSIHRSDYMLHEQREGDEPVIKQVEINTISAAFGALTTVASRLHRFIFSRFNVGPTTPEVLPINETLSGLADAIARAASLYTGSMYDLRERQTDRHREIRRCRISANGGATR
jgi:glutathione synthase